ncbi:tRNA adenosine(34) deaminase TadA [Buchnera aphidicola]|uniref:tRNA adenosine(34) deaminase TadA n=1 Tax=Buchnera aphidicola TaxID=9 RepID=UPI002238E9D0|nr:tRNA adenosine(34) deaminase TadA [Buchnera aphidicola]MCW5197671.1 tRNA adenosine(34) deaminase TadA [Buchnera aphidicola (Chaitophorus viminalis)]
MLVLKKNYKFTVNIKNYNINTYWMNVALFLAKISYNKGEVPVGAVLVNSNKVIGIGWNNSIKKNDPTAHAEIIALRNGGNYLKNYRLLNTTLYVTLEPCIMCLGAILHSRIKTLIIGAVRENHFKNILYDTNFIYNSNGFKIKIIKNILKDQCSNLIKQFFINQR